MILQGFEGEHSAVPSCHMARSSHSRAAFVGEWRIWLLPRRALFHRLRSTPGLGLRRPAAFGPAAVVTDAVPVPYEDPTLLYSVAPGLGGFGYVEAFKGTPLHRPVGRVVDGAEQVQGKGLGLAGHEPMLARASSRRSLASGIASKERFVPAQGEFRCSCDPRRPICCSWTDSCSWPGSCSWSDSCSSPDSCRSPDSCSRTESSSSASCHSAGSTGPHSRRLQASLLRQCN